MREICQSNVKILFKWLVDAGPALDILGPKMKIKIGLFKKKIYVLNSFEIHYQDLLYCKIEHHCYLVIVLFHYLPTLFGKFFTHL